MRDDEGDHFWDAVKSSPFSDVTAYLWPFYQPFAMFNIMIHYVVNAEDTCR